MNKCILIPDSFKGSMSSGEICSIMEKAIDRYYPDAKIISIPVADGGEGSVDCFLAALGGERVVTTVKGPYMEDMEAYYGQLPDKTAVVEMAACAGLPLVGDRRAAEKTTTYGVGQCIAHAAAAGCKKIILCLGGSATNDGGTGAAAALGIRFLNSRGERFVPTGKTLRDIDRIDKTELLPSLRDVETIAMCDIDNPLCGPDGAAHVFGPQKGADPATVALLDSGLAHMAAVVKRDLGADILDLPGAGAAGGMGGGMAAFLNARLQMGIETILDTVSFDSLLSGADIVFSGEGRIDSQSLRGKVVIGVARRAKSAGVPLVVLAGDVADDLGPAYDAGVSAIFSINRVAVPFSEAKHRSKRDLACTIDDLMRYTTLFPLTATPATGR
ncbi:MAG: glycerate kinase [Oscillospiraceae bacterium]|nr:glycerate kinase [Oscillospiraceae bacterium]